MCFIFSNNTKFQIATEDILVSKLVIVNTVDNTIRSPFVYKQQWTTDSIVYSDISVIKDKDKKLIFKTHSKYNRLTVLYYNLMLKYCHSKYGVCFEITKGLYSYTDPNKKDHPKMVLKNHCMKQFKIPKGSLYITDGTTIVSNQLIML